MTPTDVINFWFNEIDSSYWWKKDTAFDQILINKFATTHNQAKACELYLWRDTPLGRLAEIIVLDQFSRNMYRDTPDAFSQDSLALSLSQQAIALGADKELEQSKKVFLYMPYMHSESLIIHDIALKLFDQPGMESNLDFEVKHRKIIERFGRYPHRNHILGRASSKEEIEILNEPNSSF